MCLWDLLYIEILMQILYTCVQYDIRIAISELGVPSFKKTDKFGTFYPRGEGGHPESEIFNENGQEFFVMPNFSIQPKTHATSMGRSFLIFFIAIWSLKNILFVSHAKETGQNATKKLDKFGFFS